MSMQEEAEDYFNESIGRKVEDTMKAEVSTMYYSTVVGRVMYNV